MVLTLLSSIIGMVMKESFVWLILSLVFGLLFIVLLISYFFVRKKGKYREDVVNIYDEGMGASIEEETKKEEANNYITQPKICQNSFCHAEDEYNNYVRQVELALNNLDKDIRFNRLIENFFKSKPKVLYCLYLDKLCPADFFDWDIISNYFSKREENSSLSSQSFVKLYLEHHNEQISTDELLDDIIDLYDKDELSEKDIEELEKNFFEIEIWIETLFESIVSLNIIPDDFASKTAAWIYFFNKQNYLLNLHFKNEIMIRYNISKPKGIKDLTASVLKVNARFPIERLILYGCAMFAPFESRCKFYAENIQLLRNISQQICRENFINYLENYDEFQNHKLTLDDLNLMSGYEFENFVGDIFRQKGYEIIITKKSGDQGVDVLAKRDGLTIAVQTKCYNQPVGNKAVQEVVAGMKYYNAQKGIVVTNSNFTLSAKELAKANGIILWNGEILLQKSSTFMDDIID